jgi:hypothetical protein
MNRLLILPALMLFMLTATSSLVKASDWTCIVNLEGTWNFTVGDDMQWALPKTSTADWDQVNVPAAWERYYENYNGYGWYRRNFDIRALPESGPLVLFLGRIDDVDEVFINGVKVGQTGSFFPNYKSAYDAERKYEIPRELLKKQGNVIAVRVYDEGREGGIVSGSRIGLYFDNNYALISYDLSGPWKFSIIREKNVYEKDFNDSRWGSIKVPASWESQGYSQHDGYGWYRKRFSVPANLQNKKLFLSLGKIDDEDRVYLNGYQLGRTESRNSSWNNGNNWKKHRLYEIPQKYLQKENVLVVEVYDFQQDGGIYEGPVGLVTEKDAKILSEQIKQNREYITVWGVLNEIFN